MNTIESPFPQSRGVCLAPSARESLRTMMERVGESEAQRLLGVGNHALARCLAGLPVQRATAELVAQRLAPTRE